MISAREKGFFQLFVSLQVVLVTVFYWLCFVAIFIGTDNGLPAALPYMKYWAVVTFAMVMEGISRPSQLRPVPGRMRKMAPAVSRRQWIWILASLTLLLVFSRDLRISRFFLAAFGAVSLAVLYCSNRYLIRSFANFCSRRIINLRLRTFILGPRTWCDSIIPEIKTIHSMIEVRRVEATDEAMGGVEQYREMIEQDPIDLLIMAPRHLPDPLVIGLLRQGDRLGFRCWLPIELTRKYGRRFELQKVGVLDVLTPPVEPLENTTNQFIKRVFDIAFSSLVLVALLPWLCLVVWCIHRLYSPGPLLFKQKRVGKNGVAFEVYKFRSMHPDNPDESQQATKGDSRIFKGGDFIRKTSIDEMPQFLNVLIGDMSVVGPRPHMEKHDEAFREIFERYGMRRYVKPGVTGLAQVKGFRGEICKPQDLRNRARLDNFYVTHWDVTMDVGIVAMTGISMIKPPKSAY